MDGDIAARLRLGECQGQVIGMKIFRGKTGTHVLTKLGEDKAICWLEVLVQTAAARTTSRIALRVATRHRAARGPDRALEPIYEWADAYSPVPNNPSGIWYANEDASEQTQNQDYYLGTTNSGTPISFNGTTGVGSGTLSSRPSTCTPMVAYWATDTNTLYQCSSTNSWTAYYTPYTYPHPLTQGDPQSPQPPTGLQAVIN